MTEPGRGEDFMPPEYRKITARFYGGDIEAAGVYAEELGIGVDFQRNLRGGGDRAELLQRFQKNTALLIAKTWVDKGDEIRKEKLGARLHAFIRKAGDGRDDEALWDLRVILEEIGFLFFGEQAYKDDFVEYAFRIDAHLGLFCWYCKNLAALSDGARPEMRRALLLITICYLTNL